MSVSSTALEFLYELLCRDPLTALGGLDPVESQLHSNNGFVRCDRESLVDILNQSTDRSLEILYGGTASIGEMGHPTLYHRRFTAMIRIGYWVGDHLPSSQLVIADDEHRILEFVGKERVRPQGVVGYWPQSSRAITLDDHRRIQEIEVLVEVIGET